MNVLLKSPSTFVFFAPLIGWKVAPFSILARSDLRPSTPEIWEPFISTANCMLQTCEYQSGVSNNDSPSKWSPLPCLLASFLCPSSSRKFFLIHIYFHQGSLLLTFESPRVHCFLSTKPHVQRGEVGVEGRITTRPIIMTSGKNM